MARTLKLGTRSSNMAIQQSLHVKQMLEARFPDVQVELTIITTQGDEGQKTAASTQPLWKVEGKNFFSSEIDTALQRREIDLSVHSYKDIGSDRPEGVHLAAIPDRTAPHDLAIFHPRVLDKLKAGEAITIGTSSLRRMENAGTFLPTALPHWDAPVKLQMVPIRGNVPSRIKRLELATDHEKYVDGVIVSLAGVQRLFEEAECSGWLPEFMASKKIMILPLTRSPGSPAQGALAVECHADDKELREMLATINDPHAANHVARERAVMVELGGGCHQKFGATSLDLPHLADPILLVHGRDNNDQPIHRLEWTAPPAPTGSVTPWDGSQWRQATAGQSVEADLPDTNAIFVAHHRAVRPEHVAALSPRRLWTSGVMSWQKLAAQGLWVEGCADGFGIETLQPILQMPTLQLPPLADWGILTHAGAAEHWAEGHVVATYTVPDQVDPEAVANLQAATHIFWASGSQFDLYHQSAAPDAHHACRCGHTAQHLQKAGVKNLTVFPDTDSWRQWAGVAATRESKTA